MSSCNGNGHCLEQCMCICFDDEEYEISSETCRCGHREHTKIIGGKTEWDLYCKHKCDHDCNLVACHNFEFCGNKLPQWVLNCDNGMCNDCAISIGKIIFLDKKDDCPICLENKNMIQISCEKHTVCLDCWKTLSETEGRPIPMTCPLCRESIWKKK